MGWGIVSTKKYILIGCTTAYGLEPEHFPSDRYQPPIIFIIVWLFLNLLITHDKTWDTQEDAANLCLYLNQLRDISSLAMGDLRNVLTELWSSFD